MSLVCPDLNTNIVFRSFHIPNFCLDSASCRAISIASRGAGTFYWRARHVKANFRDILARRPETTRDGLEGLVGLMA